MASGTHLPEDIQGQLLTCRFKSRSIVRYEFIENGAGYDANVLEPLLTSKHPNFRPVDCKVGPDGAIYVADWYNSIINHAQHDFRDPRRDHGHGRIWRITYKDRPLVEKPELVDTTIEELVSYLGSPETWVRHQARKELSERDSEQVLKAAEQWVESLDQSDPDYARHLVEAMWACQNAEAVSEIILTRIIQSKSGQARSASARVIRYWYHALSDPVGMIAQLSNDSFPRARMEAVLSAGYLPDANALPAALNVLNHDRDRYLNAALPSTMTALEPLWVTALKEDRLTFNDPSHRQYAEQSAGIGLDKRLRALLADPNPTSQEIEQVQQQFSSIPKAELVRILVSAVAQGKVASEAVELAMLTSLDRVGAQGILSAGRYFSGLISVLANPNEKIAAGVASNLGTWQYRDAGDELLAVLVDDKRSSSVRSAAAVSLAQLGQTRYTNELKALARTGDILTRYLAVVGLVVADYEDAKLIVGAVLALDPGLADPVELVQSFTRIRRGDTALAAVLKTAVVHPKVVATVATYHRKTGQLPKSLQPYFNDSMTGSLSSRLMAEDRDSLTSDVVNLGDPFRGEQVFRRSEMACMSCHGIGSVGPSIGPNLVAVGTAASPSYMIESILEPNSSIAEHYENMLFTLEDSTTRMGVIAFQSEKEVIIQDSSQGGVEVKIPAAEIVSRQLMPSLMPTGLADQLSDRGEFLDLAKFLSVLGQPGAFANDESPVIRKWQVTNSNAGSLPSDGAAWNTVYSKVDGELPAVDFPSADVVFAQGTVDVFAGGKLTLNLNQTKGLSLAIDDRDIKDLSAPILLSKGSRTFTFRIDQTQAGGSGLRVELMPVEGSSLKVQPQGGI